MLAITGPKYDISRGLLVNGQVLRFNTDTEVNGTGGSYWDGAVVLLEYLQSIDIDKHLKVLELGCGIGVLSISLRTLGFENVIASDLEEIIKVTEKNSEFNNVRLETRVLDWNFPEYIDCDLVVFADCIWIMQLVEPLVKTLRLLIRDGNKCIGCYKIRSCLVHEEFLRRIKENLMVLRVVHEDGDFFVSIIENLI